MEWPKAQFLKKYLFLGRIFPGVSTRIAPLATWTAEGGGVGTLSPREVAVRHVDSHFPEE